MGEIMRLYFSLSRSTLAAVLAALILAVILFGTVKSSSFHISGDTNAKRTEYISSLYYEIDTCTVYEKKIKIPYTFSDVYEKYNELQTKAGFDLNKYKGKSATVYGYSTKDGEKLINLIVCDGKIIGGDVSDISISGRMLPLKRYGKDKT